MHFIFKKGYFKNKIYLIVFLNHWLINKNSIVTFETKKNEQNSIVRD